MINPAMGSAESVSHLNGPISPDDSRKLFRWNLFLAIFHLATGIILFFITDHEATTPVNTNFPNPDTRGIPKAWNSSPKKLWNSKIGFLSGVFLLLAGVDHLLVATIFRRSYEGYLAVNRNPFRWFEYSISAGIMHVMIAQLAGIFDIHLLFCIFGLTATTMAFGNEQEILGSEFSRSKFSLRPFWIGFVPHMVQWLVIFCYFFYTVSKGDPPAFVWAIIFVLFILDATFAVNMLLQQNRVGEIASWIGFRVVVLFVCLFWT
eukprot:c10284_g1_i2.p1 GENE.c10284_g1_i2~~c10284_g1_i2.p1  ORF type:complete len:262 (+),score=52.65 c10284_g1_i2:67-852(+)